MGTFKIFLKENDDKYAQITEILDLMGQDELDEFGNFLFYTFFDEPSEDSGDEDESEEMEFERSDIDKMIHELGSDFYDDIIELLSTEGESDDDDSEDEQDDEDSDDMSESEKVYIKYAGKKMKVKLLKLTKTGAIVSVDDPNFPKIKGKEFEIEDSEILDESWEELKEGVSRRMGVKAFNKKKRKFMVLSVAALRKTKVQRKHKAIENRSKRKRYYNANKMKIAAYHKSREAAIEKGKHFVKLRRKSG